MIWFKEYNFIDEFKIQQLERHFEQQKPTNRSNVLTDQIDIAQQKISKSINTQNQKQIIDEIKTIGYQILERSAPQSIPPLIHISNSTNQSLLIDFTAKKLKDNQRRIVEKQKNPQHIKNTNDLYARCSKKAKKQQYEMILNRSQQIATEMKGYSTIHGLNKRAINPKDDLNVYKSYKLEKRVKEVIRKNIKQEEKNISAEQKVTVNHFDGKNYRKAPVKSLALKEEVDRGFANVVARGNNTIMRRLSKADKLRQDKIIKEMEGVTFHPNLSSSNRSFSTTRYLRINQSLDSFGIRFNKDQINRQQKCKQRLLDELNKTTFIPKTNDSDKNEYKSKILPIWNKNGHSHQMSASDLLGINIERHFESHRMLSAEESHESVNGGEVTINNLGQLHFLLT